MEPSSALQKKWILAALLFGLSVITVVFFSVIHYSNRGFELSDETFYLYFSNYYNPTDYTTTNFGLLNKLACFGSPTLINLRLAKLFYQVAAVLFFTRSLLKYLRFKDVLPDVKQKLFLLVLIMASSFGHYDYLPMTMSYNSWSLILILLLMAFILTELANRSRAVNIMTSFAVGFVCFALFIAKLPNCIIAVGLYGFFNVFYIRKNILLKIPGFLAGGALCFLLTLRSSANLMALLENYRITLFVVKHAESNIYFKQIYKILVVCSHHKLKTLIALVVLLSAAFAGFILIRKIRTNATPKKNVYSYLFVCLCFMLCLPFYKGNGHKTFNDFLAVTLLIVNPFLFVHLYKTGPYDIKRFFKNDLHMVIAFLILLPVLLMIGTNNAFYYSISPTMVFAITGVSVYLIVSKNVQAAYTALYSTVVCLFALSIFYHGAIKKPYKQNNLNAKHDLLADKGLLKGIYEDRNAFTDYYAVDCIIDKLNEKRKPFITFFEFYGFTIINNCKTIPEMPLSSQERNLEMADFLLERSDVKQEGHLLLIPDTVLHNPKFDAVFHKHNIYLNQNYKLMYQYSFLSSREKINFYKSTLY